MPDRSLLTRVDDNGLDVPRWVHHLVKIATGGIALGVILLMVTMGDLAHGLRAALIAGGTSLVWFWSLRVEYWQDHKHDAPPAQLIKPDLWCDTALHIVPEAALLVYDGYRLAGAVLLAVCAIAYGLTYPDASP